jgi:hypothetical protein
MNRDAKKIRDNHAASVRRYRERVMREVLAGERPRNSIPKVNRARKARLFERNFGDKRAWLVTLPCEVTGADPENGWTIDPAHTKARGMGGCGGDKTDLVPLCRWAHRDFDAMPEDAFAAKYARTKQSVKDAAARYEAMWQAQSAGEVA